MVLTAIGAADIGGEDNPNPHGDTVSSTIAISCHWA